MLFVKKYRVFKIFIISVSGDRTYGLSHTPNAVVKADGSVLWIPSQQLMATCAINLYRFPYDRHTCSLKFGSWTFDGEKVCVKNFGISKLKSLNQCSKRKFCSVPWLPTFFVPFPFECPATSPFALQKTRHQTIPPVVSGYR